MAGANVLDIGLSGTEEMYWAVTSQQACAGIEVTASHNPIDYNGMKIVKRGSEPLNEEDFRSIQDLAERASFAAPLEAIRAKLAGLARTEPGETAVLVCNCGPSVISPILDAMRGSSSGDNSRSNNNSGSSSAGSSSDAGSWPTSVTRMMLTDRSE